jgi:hypothetical protein
MTQNWRSLTLGRLTGANLSVRAVTRLFKRFKMLNIPDFPGWNLSPHFRRFDEAFKKLIPVIDSTSTLAWKEYGCDLLHDSLNFWRAMEDVTELIMRRDKESRNKATFIDLGCSIGQKPYIASICYHYLFNSFIGVEKRELTVKAAQELFSNASPAIICDDIFNTAPLLQKLTPDSLIYTYSPVKGREHEMGRLILTNMPVGSYWLEMLPQNDGMFRKKTRGFDFPRFNGFDDARLIFKAGKDQFIILDSWGDTLTTFEMKDVYKVQHSAQEH